MSQNYFKFLLEKRHLTLISCLTVISILAFGLAQLAMSTDYRNFFSKDNPQLLAFESLQQKYDKTDNVFFILTPKDGKIFTKKTLETIRWATEQAWQTPYSSRVDSVTNFQHTTALGDDLNVRDLVESTDLAPTKLAAIREVALSEPLLRRRLINHEASVTGIDVTVQLPRKALNEVPEVVDFARTLAADIEERDPNIEVRLTGIALLDNAFSEAAKADAMSLIPAMIAMISVILAIMLRSVTLSLCTLSIFILSSLGAMGFAGWCGYKIDPILISAPTIILTIAVADSVHLLTGYLGCLSEGMSKKSAMLESLRVNLSPIVITSATTTVGFLTMNFSDSPPLNHLGNTVAVGVILAMFLSLVFLPALAVSVPHKVLGTNKASQRHMLILANAVIKYKVALILMISMISVIALSYLPKNEINDQFIQYFDKDVQFRKDSEYASSHLIAPYSIQFSFDSQKTGGISEPVFLADLEKFVKHLKTYEQALHVYGLNDTMMRLNKNMHGDSKDWYKLPDSRELAAQYLLLYEMSLPYGLDLTNQIDVDKSATRVIMTTKNITSKEALSLESSISAWAAAHIPDVRLEISSPNLMFAHTGIRSAYGLVASATLALVFISFILIAVFRSFKLGLISLAPNLLPAAIAFGVWGAIDGQVGMSVSIVVGMTLGIVVDDTIHFLSKYLRAKREKGMDTTAAVRYAFANVGNALLITTLVLVSGFLVLCFSTFRMNFDMGLVTALTIGIALIVDILLLPPLLLIFDKSERDGITDSYATTETSPT